MSLWEEEVFIKFKLLYTGHLDFAIDAIFIVLEK